MYKNRIFEEKIAVITYFKLARQIVGNRKTAKEMT